MAYRNESLNSYINKHLKGSLIPCHAWNKRIKNKPRGKTPTDLEWTTIDYPQSNVGKWIRDGLNLGYRIPSTELIIDFDPRNYNGENPEDRIAELLGFFDFDDLLDNLPVVQTGSGGYHVYCKLPDDLDPRRIKKCIDSFQGVDFKKLGGYVVAAGSKHPNGEHYEWINSDTKPQLVHDELLQLITRSELVEHDYQVGYGLLNGTQLQAIVLDRLKVSDFDSNDAWEPLLMECHHATAGDGVEEFIDWCVEDPNYDQDESTIRARWDSLDNSKDVQRTIRSLIKRLKNLGEDTSGLRSILDFATVENRQSLDDEDLDFVEFAKIKADELDVDTVLETPHGTAGTAGSATSAAKELPPNPSTEEVMQVCRLIKAASLIEAVEAKEIMIEKGIKVRFINSLLKALDEKMIHSLSEVLANTALDQVFKDRKHIMTEVNGQLYVYQKTHWFPINDEFLGKIVFGVLDTLKSKVEIDQNEINLVNNAVKTIRMRAATAKSKLFKVDTLPRPIVNCKNGELWISRDGSHKLKKHNSESYQIRCLDVQYDPSAECPLFMETLHDIFSELDDGEEVVRHIGEMLGYIIQPYKPDAQWWMFRGNGGDGKSTIIRVINAIMGDLLYSADEGLLSSGSGNGNNHIKNDLVGRAVVVIEELTKNRVLNDAGLKMLSENVKMTANPKQKDSFQFEYFGSLIMCSNNYPIIKDTSEGTQRRANVIPFTRQFVKHGKEDANRASDIIRNSQELSGVLNFMLAGYERYVQRGRFAPPQSCIDAKEKWINNADNVRLFVSERVEKSDDTKDKRIDTVANCYRQYLNWCDESGMKPKSRPNFISSMEDLSFVRVNGHNNQLYFQGGVYKADSMSSSIDDFDEFDNVTKLPS